VTCDKADILLAINLFDSVRGYGHVRAASMTKAKLQMESSLRELGIDEQTYAAHNISFVVCAQQVNQCISLAHKIS